MSVVVQVEQLVAPLGDNSEGILKEGDNNQEAADGGQVAIVRPSSAWLQKSRAFRQAPCQDQGSNSRLDGLAESVQHILNLARLLADHVQRAGFLVVHTRAAKGRGATGAQAVGRASLLSHRDEGLIGREGRKGWWTRLLHKKVQTDQLFRSLIILVGKPSEKAMVGLVEGAGVETEKNKRGLTAAEDPRASLDVSAALGWAAGLRRRKEKQN